jgi:hypothetical protein
MLLPVAESFVKEAECTNAMPQHFFAWNVSCAPGDREVNLRPKTLAQSLRVTPMRVSATRTLFSLLLSGASVLRELKVRHPLSRPSTAHITKETI